MKAMKLDAAFIPKEVCTAHDPVCILIDAVRASCTISALFDKGVREIILVEDEAVYAARHSEDCEAVWTCAENPDGTRAPGAQLSPSLEEIDQTELDCRGRRFLFRTTNGTRGVQTVRDLGIQDVLIGSLANCRAVAQAAVDLALETGKNLCVVCAGREHGQIYCIDDTFCAGIILQSAAAYAESIGCQVELQDSAKIAQAVVERYKTGEEAYAASGTGTVLRRIHRERDLLLCARKDMTALVPRVARIDGDGNVYLTIDGI